jgi:ABC-type branched-subunit amino acid transport system substrate-binding protein
MPVVQKWKEAAMDTHDNGREYGGLSLLSIALTVVAITVNHWYTLGTGALILGTALLSVSAGFGWWLRRTNSPIALAGYLLMSLWVVVGFGLAKGFWQGALRLFLGTFIASHSTVFPKPAIGTAGFELSGLLTFVGSMFVLYFAYRLLRSTFGSANRIDAWPTGIVAAGALVTVVGSAAVWAINDRDQFRPPANGVVKIGVIVPTSGPYAILGNSFVKAAQMALDDLRDTTYAYELVIRDSGPDPSKAPPIIRRVVTEDRVDAIVGGVSLIGQITKPIATDARIPHLCVCTVRAIADGAYNFTNIPSPEAEAARWVREARRRGIRNVAILSQDYPSINNHVRALKAEATRVGLQVPVEERFGDSTTDFGALIARAKAVSPDVLYVEAFNPALDRLGQQLFDARVGQVSSVVAPSVSEQPQLFEGVWYTDSNLKEMAFKKRFEDKYPDTQFATHMMPYAYDSVQMIVHAFERGQNPAVYLRNLHTYDGTAGILTKQPGSGHFESTPTVWVIKDGKPALVDGADPDQEDKP